MGDLEMVYPALEDPTPVPSTPPKKTKKIWHRKKKTSSSATTSPDTDATTSTQSGMEKGPAFRTLNQELAWGGPLPQVNCILYLFLNKI